MPRPQVSVFLGISLDGYIAGENHDLGWLDEVSEVTGEDNGYNEFIQDIDVLVMGRNTYDTILPYNMWPYEKMRVIIATRRPLEPKYGEEASDKPLPELLESLSAEGCKHVYLDGGALVRDGLKQGLVDSMTLSWLPVILGKGIPLFGPDLPKIPLKLESYRDIKDGSIQMTYSL